MIKLYWFSLLCVSCLVLLLILGERTLPLFAGDRVLAERVYKSVFMVLGGGAVAGAGHWLLMKIVQFHQSHPAPDNLREFQVTAIGLLEMLAPWLAAFLIIATFIMSVVIWYT